MKIGLSTYCFASKFRTKEMSLLDVLGAVAEFGGEHVEVSTTGLDTPLRDSPELADAVRLRAEELGIDVSNYSVSADFLQDDEAYEAEIQRLFREVDTANRLGAKIMRHDVVQWSKPQSTLTEFESVLPRIANACRRVAEYASQYGITTTVENHGFFVQQSHRVQRLVEAVGRPNYKTTLDMGNFLCVDENPVAAVKNNLPYAANVHLKDFFIRPSWRNPGGGAWLTTAAGNYIRGTIVGHGDLDIWSVFKHMKASGYDGYIGIEFEGMEDPLIGARVGLENGKRIWNEA